MIPADMTLFQQIAYGIYVSCAIGFIIYIILLLVRD
jgi:hypothetical protein